MFILLFYVCIYYFGKKSLEDLSVLEEIVSLTHFYTPRKPKKIKCFRDVFRRYRNGTLA